MSSGGEANEDSTKRRCRSDANSVTDGTDTSLKHELEHIEQRRGSCTDLQGCCDLAVAWRARGKEAVRAETLEEFIRGLLAELKASDGTPMVFPAVNAQGEWPSALKVAMAVWESCAGVNLKNERGSETRYKVALPDLAEEVMHTRRAIRQAAEEEHVVRDMLSTSTINEFKD
jgi:hypothetical protein